jgi:hypothetical protein
MNKTQTILAVVLSAATVMALGGQIIRAVARTEVIEARVSVVEDDAARHKIEVRMEKLQERMWAMEDRWGDKFSAEKGRIHDSLEELLHFMTKEARDQFRALQAEYAALERELEKLDES